MDTHNTYKELLGQIKQMRHDMSDLRFIICKLLEQDNPTTNGTQMFTQLLTLRPSISTDLFIKHLASTCNALPKTIDRTDYMGRPHNCIADIMYGLILKEHLHLSYRKLMPYIEHAFRDGYISSVPSYNSFQQYANSPLIKQVLLQQLNISDTDMIKAIDNESLLRTFTIKIENEVTQSLKEN